MFRSIFFLISDETKQLKYCYEMKLNEILKTGGYGDSESLNR